MAQRCAKLVKLHTNKNCDKSGEYTSKKSFVLLSRYCCTLAAFEVIITMVIITSDAAMVIITIVVGIT